MRAADQVNETENSTPTLASAAVLPRLESYVATQPVCRRSSAAPLGRIDYNLNILSPMPPCPGLAMALPPRELTPGQAALAHALGLVQGRAFVMLA